MKRGIWIVGLLAAAVAAAAVGAHASPAASSRVATGAATIDGTYSCGVRRAHFILLSGSVTLPPIQNQPQPGVLNLTTVSKTVVKKGATVTVSQLGLSANKSILHIDKSTCTRVKRRVPLKSKGLSGPPETVTPNFEGHVTQRCGTKTRVLVHVRLTTNGGKSTHAVLAIRNDDAKHKPVVFWNWTPGKITSYTANSCVDVN
jgi:hypothetical protein